MLNTIRKQFSKDISGAYIGMFYWFTLLAFLFYYFFPFKLIGLTAVVTVTWMAIRILFKEKHRIVFVHYLNITLAASALFFDWHWGFSFLGFPLERYYCWVILAGSLFAYLGRFIVLRTRKGGIDVKNT